MISKDVTGVGSKARGKWGSIPYSGTTLSSIKIRVPTLKSPGREHVDDSNEELITETCHDPLLGLVSDRMSIYEKTNVTPRVPRKGDNTSQWNWLLHNGSGNVLCKSSDSSSFTVHRKNGRSSYFDNKVVDFNRKGIYDSGDLFVSGFITFCI